MHRALTALLLTGCSASTLDLSARRTTTIDGGLEWVTLATATDAFGNPGRGAVSLQSPTATVDHSPGTLDADGVASFVTRCVQSDCSEPIELSASWNGLTTTRTRLPIAERWTDTAEVGSGGGLGSSTSTPPSFPGCDPHTVCVGEPWVAPMPGPPPCVEASLGGAASLHLVLRGPAGSSDTLEVTVSNGALESCRAGLALISDTTFAGMSPGAWKVIARGSAHTGATTVAISSSSLLTDTTLLIH